MDKRIFVPEYSHYPAQYFLFDVEEAGLLAVAYFLGTVFTAKIWLVLVPLLYFGIRWKRSMPRGYISHLIYSFGGTRMQGYPDPSCKRFYE